MSDDDITGTENKAHNTAVLAAHNVRAAAYKTATTQAQLKAADIVWARSIISSAKANNITVPNTVQMLWELTGQYS